MKDAEVKKIKEILIKGHSSDIVFLSGESGSARYTTLKLLCSNVGMTVRTESQVEAIERQNLNTLQMFKDANYHTKRPKNKADHSFVDEDEDREKYFSQTQLIELVFQYANSSENCAYLIRFLPDTLSFDWFKRILQEYYDPAHQQSTRSPIFFSINEELEGTASFKRKVTEALNDYHFKLHVIKVSSNETNIIKALQRVVKRNLDLMKRVAIGCKLDEVVKDIARDTLHNIHLSLASLQLFVCSQYRSNRLHAPNNRLKQARHVFGDNIFHKIGKVLYNKRLVDPKNVPPEVLKDATKKGNYRYEGEKFDTTKNLLYFRPEELVDSLQSERSAYRFRLGIQNNYLDFSGDIRDCAKIANGICKIDVYLRNFKKNNHFNNFEEESMRLTSQYAYNFMNNSRYPPPPRRGKAALEAFGLKTYMTKPAKLSNAELDKEFMCPELKILLRSEKARSPKKEPIEILEDISSDSESEGMTLAERLKRTQLKVTPREFTEPAIFKALFTQTSSKASQNPFCSQMTKINKSTLEDEIGDIVSISSSSCKLEDSELELLESTFYRNEGQFQIQETQTRLSTERHRIDEEFDNLDQLLSNANAFVPN